MRFISLLLSLVVMSGAASADLSELWTVEGFKMPESVVYDTKRDRFYVSNVNMGVMEQDNNGSIGYIAADGSHSVVDWVSGLSSPKGIDLYNNYLYVADVKELVVIDVDKEKIVARYLAPESGILNGLTVSENGDVFVSDWIGNKIFKLQDHGLALWLDSTDLESPNGLWVSDQYLYVSAWGKNPAKDFSTETSGMLKRISLKTKVINNVNQKGHRWMNLDGIHKKSTSSWYVSDFKTGELLQINNNGKLEETYKLEPSAADFYYIDDKKMVIVPYLMSNKVVAYKVN